MKIKELELISGVILVVLLFVLYHLVFADPGRGISSSEFGSRVSRFSDKELASFRLIKELDEFESRFDFEPSRNFLTFEEDPKRQKIIYLNDVRVFPRSYADPKMIVKNFESENVASIAEELLKNEKININNLDYYIPNILGVSGGSIVTRKLINSSEWVIVYIHFHENFHDNTRLPAHFNESAATVAGIVGYCKFKGMNEKKTKKFLEDFEKENNVRKCLQCYSEIESVHEMFIRKGIDLSQYISKKNAIVRRYGYVSVTQVSFNRTYYVYFDLLKRLMIHLRFDLKEFLFVMRGFTDEGISGYPRTDEFFKKTLEREKEIAEQIEKMISK